MLTFFFDGVPEPGASVALADVKQRVHTVKEAETAEESERAARTSTSPYVSVHPPYQERACEDCHDRTSVTFLVMDAKQLCFLCHDSSEFEGPYVHGPVAVGDCVVCHHPHQSRQEHLLLGPVRDLCLSCHRAEDVYANENHVDVENCLDCHNPHAGEDEMLMW